jgi:putative copper resistance protein D
MIELLAVLLRGAVSAGTALALGGVVLVLVVMRTDDRRDAGAGDHERRGPDRSPARRALALVAGGAAFAALAQLAALGVALVALSDGRAWPVAEAWSTAWLRSGLARAGVLAAVALLAARARRAPAPRRSATALVLGAVAAAALGAWATHAAARVDGRAWPMALDAVHQTAVAVWVGGLAHLLLAWPLPRGELRRFSAVAAGAVGVLAVTGAGLAALHVDGVPALVGTSYGAMLATKVALFAGLAGLGAGSHVVVRRLGGGAAPPARLRRLVEVEAGVALTLVFVAASLASAPPAADVVADRVTPAEIAARLAPRWPELATPTLAELAQASPLEDRTAPRTSADRRWSEFNHNVAGLAVLAMGVLAVVERSGRARWARAWPLLFLPLSAFLLLRSDPGGSPLGTAGLAQALRDPEILQHWAFGLLPAAFGVVEWLHRTGRIRPRPWAYLFPLLSAVGGGLLLSHAHTSSDAKEAFLMELTHLPLGLLAVATGWARWLELRLPPADARAPGRVWAPAMALMGVLLLFYHEQ